MPGTKQEIAGTDSDPMNYMLSEHGFQAIDLGEVDPPTSTIEASSSEEALICGTCQEDNVAVFGVEDQGEEVLVADDEGEGSAIAHPVSANTERIPRPLCDALSLPLRLPALP